MNPTRAKLLDATAAMLREEGYAALSARTIAGRAGVNQALVFYHFGTVADLVAAACRQAIDAAVEEYRPQLEAVGGLGELVSLGRRLHAEQTATGNLAMLAQLLAGARHDDVLAGAARYGMGLWVAEIEGVLRRVLSGNPLGEVVEVGGLARAVAAGFVGVELHDGVDPESAGRALDALEQLVVLVEAVGEGGPVVQRAVRAGIRAVTR